MITDVIQSSTAMTVMVVGLVNSGVLGLRAAISGIGTTLTNTLITLPLGLYGLLFEGIAALIMVFSKRVSTRNGSRDSVSALARVWIWQKSSTDGTSAAGSGGGPGSRAVKHVPRLVRWRGLG